MSDFITHDHEQEHDGIDRRGFLKCMAWAGTGVLWTVSGGVLASRVLGAAADAATKTTIAKPGVDFTFAQISDSHIGFNKDANKDVIGTLQKAIAKLNALPNPPDFILHTGDLTHLSEAEEFDALDQNLKSIKTGQIFYVPGEHDVISDNGAQYRERFGKNSLGAGWYSFDKNGVHFVALVNVVNIKEGGLGILGPDQLDWLSEGSSEPLSGLASPDCRFFAHIPLLGSLPAVGLGYPDDAEQALGFLTPLRIGNRFAKRAYPSRTVRKVRSEILPSTPQDVDGLSRNPRLAPAPVSRASPDEGGSWIDLLRFSASPTRTLRRKKAIIHLAVVDSTLA